MVVVLAASAFFFLPSLLGLQPVLHAVRDMTAGQLPGNLEAASCSLGWIQGLRCEQLRYNDPERGVRFEAPQFASDKGLLLLLAAPSYLGEITIDQPTLSFLPPQPGHEPPPIGRSAATEQAERGKSSWWEHLTVRLKVNGGQLVLGQGDTPSRHLARQIDLTGSLAMGTIHYDLRFLSAQQTGHFQAKGFVNLPMTGQSFLETLVSRAEVDIVDLEIADFLDLAASRSRVPRGRGVLNATLRLKAAGIEEFEARGETVLREVQLAGGVLGEDRPQFDQLRFAFTGSHRQGEGWRLSALELQSEPVRLNASGSFDGNTVSLAAKGSVNLSVLAAQVPHLLGLHEQTAITGGTADFSLDIAGGGEAFAMRADCRSDRLRLVHDGHSYVWDTPLALEVEADYGGEKTGVRTLRLHTPFFEARGSGNPDGFTLQGGGDLDQMFQELEKIFALNVHAKGRAELSVATRREEDGGLRLDSRIAIHDFALSRGQKSLFPAHDFSLTGMAVTAPSFFRDGALHSLSLNTVSWPGTASLRAEDMQRNVERTENNCTLKGTVDLERLSGVLHGLGDGTAVPVLKGELHAGGAGECEGARIALQSMQGTIERLVVAGAEYAFQEPRVTFGLGSSARFPGRRVAVRELTVAENWQDFSDKARPIFLIDGARRRLEIHRLEWASARTVLETDWMIADWRQPGTDYLVTLRGEADGPLLVDVARTAGWLAPDLTVTGRVRGALTTGSVPDRGNTTELALETEPFAVLRGKTTLFSDPRLVLKVSLHGEAKDGGAMRMPSFFLNTAPVRIEGAGLVSRNTPPSLEVQGQITPDFTALAPLLEPLIGREVEVSGNRAGEFLLALPLSIPVRSEQVTFTAQLPVNTLRFQGIGLHRLTLPVACNRGKLRLSIDGQLDGGRATLEPAWDLAARQPVISLPAGTQVLKDVVLKPPLAGGLLGRMHPLFGSLAHPQGTVDLRVDSFSVPVTEKGVQKPTFVAAVGVDRIKFKPIGVLRQLLDLGGIDQEWLRCREQEVVCEGKAGRVSCGPLHFLAGETEIGLRGEMFPDGSLRYRVRLPAAKSLTDLAQLVVQAKTTVEAEINGTRDKPVFDQPGFLAGLGKQLSKGIELTEHSGEEGQTPQPGPEQPLPAEASP
jgi:hypothetical protein